MQSGCTDHPLWSPTARFQPELSAKEKCMAGSHPLHRPYVNMSTTSHHKNDTHLTTLLKSHWCLGSKHRNQQLREQLPSALLMAPSYNNSPQETVCLSLPIRYLARLLTDLPWGTINSQRQYWASSSTHSRITRACLSQGCAMRSCIMLGEQFEIKGLVRLTHLTEVMIIHFQKSPKRWSRHARNTGATFI